MEKRPFLLLEILIALSLVIICILPLVRQPLKLYKEEMQSLEKMELERLAEWTFTEVKELLLKNDIPWEAIPQKDVETGLFSLSTSAIHIPGCNPEVIERSFSLKGKGEKIGYNGTIYRQLRVNIFLNQQQYEFRIPVSAEGYLQHLHRAGTSGQ